MKKYIILSVITFMFTFLFINNVYAKTNLTTSEVKAVAEILRTLKVSEGDITRITNILNEDTPIITPVPVIVPTKPYQYIKEGCNNGKNIYNTVTGNVCPKYQTSGTQA